MVFSIECVVIGAGQAGLAVSRCLTEAGVDHIVLERGRVGERWRSQRWDSLRLLSPNWATRLPSWSYRGSDPDGFMTAAEFAEYLEGYAASFAAPVQQGIAVSRVEMSGEDYLIRHNHGSLLTNNVVVATGWCDQPHVPELARGLSPSINQLTASSYRNPDQLPPGGVLVVGGSASGVQLADELARAGRDVALAVGSHRRLPRRYRGRDIWRWLEEIGTFGVTIDEVADPAKARAERAVQLIGREGQGVDLPALRNLGISLVGRLTGIDGTQAHFADDLLDTSREADLRMRRILAEIDRRSGTESPEESTSTAISARPLDYLDLHRTGIRTVLWATGYVRRYPWLQVPVLGSDGEIIQRRGLTPVDGMYVVGQRFQHRRDSGFIDGVRHDAAMVAHHIAGAGSGCALAAS